MSDLNDKIRARAHQLWLDEGCPDGAADRHWAMAESQVMEEEAALAASKPKRQRAPRKPKATKAAASSETESAAKVEKAPKAAKTTKPKLKVVSDRGAA